MKSYHFYRIAQCSSKNPTTLSSFTMTFHDLCYFPWLFRPGKWSSYIPWLSMTRGHLVEIRTDTNPNKLCRWRHNMPPPLSSPAPHVPPSRRNVAVVSHAQYVLTVTAAPASRVKATLSKAVRWPWPFTLKVVSQVTCDVGYLCANFSLPRPLCSRLRSDVCDRQTPDVRQNHHLMPPIRGGA